MKTPEQLVKDEYQRITGHLCVDLSKVTAKMTCAAFEAYADQFKIAWIDVNDELPPVGNEVIVYLENHLEQYFGYMDSNKIFHLRLNSGVEIAANGRVKYWHRKLENPIND